jgi:hypothetical protein
MGYVSLTLAADLASLIAVEDLGDVDNALAQFVAVARKSFFALLDVG